MRITTLSLLALLFAISCETNDSNESENQNIPGNVDIESYRSDAVQLYYQEIIDNTNHPNYTEAEFDYDQINEIFDLIKAVYELDVPQRDTVFLVHNIHARYCNMTNVLGVNVQTDAPEIQNLAAGVIPTGNEQLDGILEAYAFDSVDVYYGYPDFSWLSLYTSEAYNMIPVAEEFATVNSILQATMYGGCIGDGNTITLERNNDFATLTFSIGWGDCPAGCINHRYWEFRVTNGSAEFIQAYEN